MPRHHEQAEEIFYEAQALTDPDERSAFIERACVLDVQVREEVREMLAAHTESERFFRESTPALEARIDLAQLGHAPSASDPLPALDETPGTRIGAYRVLQKIGEGGHGVVYLAQQDEPVRRRVALKVIKLGMDTRGVIARFEAERQALAMMDHPCIARALDAGATSTGRPFFVMELVNGARITEYCDANKLSTRQRLELFIEVCQAIQHAHQKGIIHRDVKPSNILVTLLDGAPLPKVIDFGIAKAIEEKLTDKTLFTLHGHFIGTPAYMSPEQAQMSAVDADTRSDIYSLGVLLYELLTGRTPFNQEELLASGIDEMRRTLREREPSRPSDRLNEMPEKELTLTAQQRNLEPQKLRSTLHGDLDWIVMKALEKDRNRRYQTANALAADVRHYLANEPVIARPPTRLYRLKKMVDRNKVIFAAGMAVVVAVTLGFGISLSLFLGERAARQRAVHAERTQAHLLKEAQDRERMTQAAFRISHNQYLEADKLVSQVTSLRPSVEAVLVLRSLGEWHLFRNETDLALERFKQLLEVDQQDNSWTITDDLLRVGPILVERGDLRGYEHFRRIAITRLVGNTDALFAERTLKISLLVPTDDGTLKSLEAFNTLATKSFENDPQNAGTTSFLAAWRCVSLALMAYRQNYTPTAKEWCRKSLLYPENATACVATTHIIAAMANCKLGELNEARAELGMGRELVEAEFAGGIKADDLLHGLWYDWLFAQVLLREADNLLAEASLK